MRWALKGLLATALVAAVLTPATATHKAEYRAFWVDTFNTLLNTATDVTAVVNNAQNANANVIVVQVRRRGDAWYRLGRSCANSAPPCEPLFVNIDANFDPLADLIMKATSASTWPRRRHSTTNGVSGRRTISTREEP
jgi:uncharacterized lipoprotein YddW (UPF0748 family)